MICLVFELSKNILAYFQNYFPTSQFPQLIHPPGARHPAWGQERRCWSDPSVETTAPPPAPGGVGMASPTGLGIPGLHGVGGDTAVPTLAGIPRTPTPHTWQGSRARSRGALWKGSKPHPGKDCWAYLRRLPTEGHTTIFMGQLFYLS